MLIYFAATVLLGALLAPILYWGGQFLAEHGIFPALGKFDFETFFHRALLLAAVILLWPLLRSIEARTPGAVGLRPNPKWRSHLVVGFLISVVPLLCCGATLLLLHLFRVRMAITGRSLVTILLTTVAVPLIEEGLFRGLVLGILLRSSRVGVSVFLTSAFYSIVHFLKAPDRTSATVSWTSGFNSIAHSFAQFGDPMLVAEGFTTLFLVGWILADARLRTSSLWLPIGLHAGWIFGNGVFNKFAHQQRILAPWLGKNLLVGIIPLFIVGLTWVIMRGWLRWNVKT